MILRTRLIIISLCWIWMLSSCNEGRFKQGKILYDFHCAGCHMEDGTGLAGIYPPVNGSDFLMNYKEKLPNIIRFGIEGPILVNGQEYDIAMSGIPELSAVEISNISNYIFNAWTNDLGIMSFAEVMESLEEE